MPPDTTTFNYVQTASVMETGNATRMRRITFPLVDEVLPGGHGKIRREFVGEADLDALGLSATNKRHESERDIRRGLLENTTYYDASGNVIQREQTDWQVTTSGTWTGAWQWYYHRGMPQQAYWLRPGTITTTKDGVTSKTVQTHNPNNGLIASQTLKSGSHTLRVTDTSYHADAVTSSPVALTIGQPVLDTTVSQGGRSVHAAFLSRGDPPTASVEAFLNAGSNVESSGVYNFLTDLFSVSGHDVVRIRGTLGTDQLSGGDNMYADAQVTIRWKDGSVAAGSHTAHAYSQDVATGGGLPAPEDVSFDVLVPVPAGADSALVDLKLHASVYKPMQNVYRKIRIYATDLDVTGLSADDPEDVFLERAHILDRPHVVTVKDGSGTKLQSTRTRYGRFNLNGIVMPDTTSVWLDGDGDGEISPSEWIDRQVATDYDVYGNLTESKDAQGTVTSTIMGYDDMRPLATFTGAAGSQVIADIFDDHHHWNSLFSLAAVPGTWSKYRRGTASVSDGVLKINNTEVLRKLPSYTSGVLEADVRVNNGGEETYIALAAGLGSSDERIRWILDSGGTFKARNGTATTATGVHYAAHQWYHVRIEWSSAGWWARVDGVRYPATGSYALRSQGSPVNLLKLSNAASSGDAFFDNIRTWPAGAQPVAMTTYDPVTLDAVASTDPNGHTTRYLRDGLRRVVQTIDGAGRVTAQRDHDFSRTTGSTSVYNTGSPNRQTDIAYLSRDGHKDLSRDGHRTVTRGAAPAEGITLEEGVSLATGGPYVVASGQSATLRASVRVRLTTGFKASAGSDFRALIDPLAGANEVTGSGDISYNQQNRGLRSVKLGPSSVLETGRISGRVTARADFYPGSTSSGKTVIMAFEDGGDYVRMVYENGNVSLKSSLDGLTSTDAMVPGYNRRWPWARVEMELLPTGKVNAWVYGHKDTRHKGSDASVTVPANWTPAFRAAGESGDGYLAGLYVGTAEVATIAYDGLARQMQTRAGAGASDIVTQTTYNRVNKPAKLLGPAYLSPSYDYGALAESAAAGRVTRTTYDDDPLLRVSSVVPPGHDNNSAVNTRYGTWGTGSGPGRSYVTVDDEKGVATTRVYDAYGRMSRVIADSAGTSAGTRNNETSYAHDALDRRTSTTMPGGGTSRYAYDTLGRMTSRHHPDADAATLYKYDDLGRVRFSQDARQSAAGTGNATEKVTFTVYDAFGRVTRVGEAAATFSSLDPEQSYAFESGATSWRSRMTYDSDLLGSGPNYAQGRLTKVEENTDADAAAEVVHLYAYDHLGSVRVKRVTIEGLTGARTAEYVHDLAGRVTRLIYPDGAQARYAYDSAGRLARVWDAQGNTLAAYTHTAAGNIATHVVGHSVADGTGGAEGAAIVTGTFAYNPRDWVTGIDYAGTFASALTYDHAGNVTRQVYSHGSAASKTADYAYDDLYRITGFDVSGGTGRDYAYDRSGNITSVVTGASTLTYNYSAASTPNRLDSTTGTGGQTYAYNQNGWMTGLGTDTVAYDYRGLTTGVGTAAYLMDPDKRRVKKTVGTSTTYYLRGPGGSVLAEYAGQTLSARYVYAGSRRIARIAGSSASYYLADHLGSTRSLVGGEGTVTAAYDYWPYGKILASSGSGATHFRFTGHERDSESGLDYMLARSYAYDVGRFLRPDPLQDEYPGLSPYAYANNNPLKFVDPDGMKIIYSSSLSREEQTRLEDYIATLQKSSYGKQIYEDVQRADEVFFIGFSELGGDFGGVTEVEFDPEETERDPRTGRILKTKVKYGVIGIDESKILGTPGAMIEGVIGHEFYHAWQAIYKTVKYRNRHETQKDLPRNEQDNEKEADEIQRFIQEQLKKLLGEEDSNE